MFGFLRVFSVVAVLGVILLQHPAACWAAETTDRGVTGSIYAGTGKLQEPNNESNEDEYDVRRIGVGGLGVVRFGSQRGERGAERGFFGVLGGTVELEGARRTLCGYACPHYGSPIAGEEPRDWGKHFAARLGVGYSFSIFEFRLGGLAALPDPHVTYGDPLIFPDVVARIGQRSSGWFELGLGAYDASTTLRPGLYVGGAFGELESVRVSGHFGAHLVNGLCCSTVPHGGLRGEVGLDHAFTQKVSAGASVAFSGDLVVEGNAHVTFAL